MRTIAAPEPESPPRTGDDVDLRGVVQRLRALKGRAFLHVLTPFGAVQVVVEGALPDGLREQATVRVRGACVAAALRDPTLSFRGLEVHASGIEVLSIPASPPPFDLGRPTVDAGAELVLDHRPASLRHPRIRAVFRVQDALCRGFREALHARSFVEIHSPKVCAEGAEGGANVFELGWFGRRAYLAQSPQFYKEMGTGAFLRVFEVGPVFRAEKHATTRHLAEYTSLDVEHGPIASFEEVMATEVGVLRAMIASVGRHCLHELELLGVALPEVGEIPAVTFAEAKGWTGGDGDDLAPAEELAIAARVKAETGSDLVFVTHWPSSKRPFYAMDDPEDPERTVSFDLLFRGLEITTGGQRVHDLGALEAKMRARGLDPAAFAFFTQAHRYGLPPHGGFGLGLERLTQRLLGLDNVREATLFPRDRHRLAP